MRLALVLAAPFPLHQGSQVFVAEQARALRAAGAEPTLFCYGAGTGEADPALPVVRTPAAITPRTLRSSAHPRKAMADLALCAALRRAQRSEPFDVLLAHNAEAALAALLVRNALHVPVVYVVHTLLRHELSAYGPGGLERTLDAVGRGLDRHLARRADAILTLCPAASEALTPAARGPIVCIPPGLDPTPLPDPAAARAACRRHGLAAGGFVLYAGNVDRYQDLDLLDAAARRLPGVPVVVATHDRADARFAALRVVEVADAEEMRALLSACSVAALPRRRPGGFPIKLLNYQAAGRPIVAHADVAAGLRHEREAWLLPRGADAQAWAAALQALLGDPARAASLGRAARAHWTARHGWEPLARRTLTFLESTAATRKSGAHPVGPAA